MILVNYEGVPIGGNVILLVSTRPRTKHGIFEGNMSRPANAAGFLIHSAVHKARPDVDAACHTHSPHGMAWSAFGRPLEMLTQDAAYLYGDAQAVYKVPFVMTVLVSNLTSVGLRRRRAHRKRGQ